MIKTYIFNSSRPQARSTSNHKQTSPAFTIVELLVVIVVIGILAAITIVSYVGISNRAKIVSLQSDLTNTSDQLKIYQATNGSYPTSATDCPNPASTNICSKASNGASYTSYAATGTGFTLVETASDGVTKWQITDSTAAAVYANPWANWDPGITATALAGKYVYKTDLGLTMQYKTTNTSVTSPQGATGLDPNYPSNMSLVSPQTNPGVDFSAYPAQNACKAIGGRLPNMQELLAIYAGQASYGNNFQVNEVYWSSTESSIVPAYEVSFNSGSAYSGAYSKSVGFYYIRCVSG